MTSAPPRIWRSARRIRSVSRSVPSAGVPQDRDVGGWKEWLGAHRHRFAEWILSMTRGGPFGLISGVLSVALSVPGLLTLLAAAIAWLLRHRRTVAAVVRKRWSSPTASTSW